jgi:hypothetical protein
MLRDIVWKAGQIARKPAPAQPKAQGGIKIKTGVHSGGIDPNHSRALLEKTLTASGAPLVGDDRSSCSTRARRGVRERALSLRLLAVADRRIASRERLLMGWRQGR